MRGFAGFGSGMLKSPVFAILFGPVETVVVTVQLMPSVLGNTEGRFVGPMGAVAAEMERLAPLIADGIYTVEESRITVTG